MTKFFVLAALSVLSFSGEPKQKVEMTKVQWSTHLRKMSVLRQYLDASNLPHQDVIKMENDLDDFMLEISKQLQAQEKATDSTKKK